MKSILSLALVLGLTGIAAAADYQLQPAANPTGKGGPIMQRTDRPDTQSPDYQLTGDTKDSKPLQATRPTTSTHDQNTVIVPNRDY